MKVLIDLPNKKAELLKDLKESVDQINSFKKGKIKLRSAKDFLKSL